MGGLSVIERAKAVQSFRSKLAVKFPRRRRGGIGHALQSALDGAIAAREIIPEAQQLLREQPYRDNTPEERAAREYQIDLVAWQLNRAADVAEERLRYIEAIQTPEQIEAEHAKCAKGVEGTIHWFEYYAWGYDPREDAPLAIMPFVLFKFQERYVRWVESLIFAQKASGMVEKARDMGATVGAINLIVKQWRYRPGFSAMLTSATEDLVDSQKDPDTLFEKVRFQIRLLPNWMLPSGLDVDKGLTYMNIPNPENGAVITGQAPTKKVGRQRRRTVVLCDEFQVYPQGGYPQYTSLSQTTRSILVLGTPEGKFNKYAELRHSGHANVFEMDWKEHPWKDKRWYDSLRPGYCGPPMTDQQIAQEIERNYDASQPGKVFPGWREEYTLITWSELVAYYKRFKLDRHFLAGDGSYRVPYDWTWGRTHDYGQTDQHPWIVTHAARPRENYPLHDSVFVFSCHRITPTAAAVGEAQPQIDKVERGLGFRDYTGKMVHRYEFSENSHEAEETRKTFRDEFGEYWTPWNTDYNLGIPQIQEWIRLIQPQMPNPIRPALSGRTRIYFVAPDDEYRLVLNESSGGYFVTPSKTDAGFKLLRLEMPAYHYPPSEQGKAVKDMRPLKLQDDTIDTIRAFATHWGPGLAPKTVDERVNDALPEHLRDENVGAMSQGRRLAREIAIAEQRAIIDKEDVGDFGSFWDGTS
jgi:hypothetical protein